MSRQIAWGYQQPSVVVLEQRMHQLETRVAALGDAVRLLVGALEDAPVPPPRAPHLAVAVRQAHELLMTADHPARGG
jgi:hypothetical protein